VSLQAYFGWRLRHWRTLRDLTQTQLGKLTGDSADEIRKVELAHRWPPPGFAERCDTALAADGELATLWPFVDKERRAQHTTETRLDAVNRPDFLRLLGVITAGTLIEPSGGVPHGIAAAEAKPDLDLLLLDPLRGTPEPVDAGYVASVRGTIARLVALDNQFGGDDLASLAVRAFRAVDRRLAAGRYEPKLEPDLRAAAGELAEVAGWLLYDADRHDDARRLNHEALLLSRLAGDRATELLVIQNMSMHASRLGRPQEALRLVTTALEHGKLSPRVQALFAIREARARAQLGQWTTVPGVFARVRALFMDGVADGDPSWAWWVTPRELDWHEAMCHTDLEDWPRAVELFQRAVTGCPVDLARTRFNDLGHLLQALAEVSAWSDADGVIAQTLPYVGEVRSSRTARLLLDATKRIAGATTAPTGLREAAVHLRTRLTTAGC